MPHAIRIRQTGAPEVLSWTPVEVGEPGCCELIEADRRVRLPDATSFDQSAAMVLQGMAPFALKDAAGAHKALE
jgi:hypothetical protein